MARLAVQFEVHLDGQLFLGRTLAPKRPLRLGPGPRCEIPTTVLRASLPLLTPGTQGYGLHLAPPLAGEISAGGRRLRVRHGLLCDPRPEPLRLVDGDGGGLELEPGLRVRFQVVRARRAFRWQPALEPRLVASVGAALAAAALLMVAVARYSTAPSSSAGREARLQSRPALLDLARLRHRAAARPAPRQAAPVRSAPRLQAAARPSRRGAVERRGLLGLLDPRLQPPAGARHARDPLAAVDRLLISTEPLLTSSPSDRGGTRDRLAAWLGTDAVTADLAGVPARRRRLGAPAAPLPARASGGPTREQIREAVARGTAGIRLCYERELLTTAELREGRLVLRWRIDAAGRATAIRVVKDTVLLPGLRECVLQQVTSWVFPPCPEACEVTYPFEFFARS